jgi:hypothetical protein
LTRERPVQRGPNCDRFPELAKGARVLYRGMLKYQNAHDVSLLKVESVARPRVYRTSTHAAHRSVSREIRAWVAECSDLSGGSHLSCSKQPDRVLDDRKWQTRSRRPERLPRSADARELDAKI